MGGKESKDLSPSEKKALKKFEDDKAIHQARLELIALTSNDIIVDIVESVRVSFRNCSPLSEATLFMAWIINPVECEQILIEASRRVLNQPIDRKEFEWYKKYVISSAVLLFKKTKITPEDQKEKKVCVYNFIFDIVSDYQKTIIASMNGIYEALKHQDGWYSLIGIRNIDDVMRQDDPKVGLLTEATLLRFKESVRQKITTQEESKEDGIYTELETFIDSHLVTNILVAAAQAINKEFQNYINSILGEYGKFQPGPLKEMGRCASKVENDYKEEPFPKTAKLCDLVRCSVTFNTLSEMLSGYHHMMNHVRNNANRIEIARIKNGFLNVDAKSMANGYRDLKMNMIFHSAKNKNLSMICEMQLILSQYLWEKKKIHKLYSIQRLNTAAGGAGVELIAAGGGGCFDANSEVLLVNGMTKKAKDVNCGDILQTYILDGDLNLIESENGSRVKMVLSLERCENADRFYMVNFENKLWVTPKHPVFNMMKKRWMVPKKEYKKTNENFINHTIDFVMENDHIINVNGLILITMAHKMFDRFPELFHPIKATDVCIDYWKIMAGNTFPQCKMIIGSDNKYVEKV